MQKTINKCNLHFSKAFTNAEHIHYDKAAIIAVKELKLSNEEVVSFTDFKDRRVIVFGTNFGNFGVTEECSDDKYSYLTSYNKSHPLKDLVPSLTLTDQDLLYVCGSEDYPNISERVDSLIASIQEYFK